LTKVLRFTQADWYKKKDTIKKVVIEDGITGIGTLAITNMTHLESIEIKGTNVELARGAVNNYQGNHNSNPTLTMIVPLSVYQQNQMEKGKWFEAASDSREDEGTWIQRRQGHHRAQPERGGGAAAQDADRGAVRYLQWRDPPGAGAVLLLCRAGLGDGRV